MNLTIFMEIGSGNEMQMAINHLNFRVNAISKEGSLGISISRKTP